MSNETTNGGENNKNRFRVRCVVGGLPLGETEMQLVERHLIKKTHQYWSECDRLSFKAKNLYNLCTYYMRQLFFESGKALSNTDFYHKLSGSSAYKQMPSTKIDCSLIRQLCPSWKGYLQAHRDWNSHREKYLSELNIPKYKDKVRGRYSLIYKKNETIYKKPLHLEICHLYQSQIKLTILSILTSTLEYETI
ncbi:MAG: hypothetical protein F6K10_23950 [Moorea sp. SIO2B7]|nr:hypothetical protein [Moorena sp. SIO2B7]